MTDASILIVEDAAITAAVLEDVVGRLGYRVCGNVMSGEEAVEQAAIHKPDLVLMDIQLMGAMDGIQAAAIIREQVGSAIVFLSAFSADSVLNRARVSGPFGYLVKPVKDSDLRSTIEMALYKNELDRQKEALARDLARAEKLASLGRMLAGFVHALANPLHAIQAHVELANLDLESEGHAGGAVSESLGVISSEVSRLTSIVQRLRVVAQREPGRTELLDPEEVLREVIGENERKLVERGVAVECDWMANASRVEMVREHLRMIFDDLVSNSLASLGAGGMLHARAASAPHPANRTGDGILVEFSDDGPGLAPAAAERLFEPFSTSNPRRAGLGLFTVAALADYYGGSVSASSSPGKGTTISIWLPAAAQ